MKATKLLTLSISIILILIIQSCKKDLCKSTICNNGATCEEGICNCATGYEGTNCDDLWRDKLLGDYTYEADCTNGQYGPTDISFKASADNKNEMIIDEFNYDFPLVIRMTGEKTMEFPLQAVCDVCPEFQGSGSVDEQGVVRISFDFVDQSYGSCNDTYTPR